MKVKKSQTLMLNKKTISNLIKKELDAVRGGRETDGACYSFYCSRDCMP